MVTTTRVTHASPAGIYAHAPERGWENDGAVGADGHDSSHCKDIAQQLIMGETGSKLNVRTIIHQRKIIKKIAGDLRRRKAILLPRYYKKCARETPR